MLKLKLPASNQRKAPYLNRFWPKCSNPLVVSPSLNWTICDKVMNNLLQSCFFAPDAWYALANVWFSDEASKKKSPSLLSSTIRSSWGTQHHQRILSHIASKASQTSNLRLLGLEEEIRLTMNSQHQPIPGRIVVEITRAVQQIHGEAFWTEKEIALIHFDSYQKAAALFGARLIALIQRNQNICYPFVWSVLNWLDGLNPSSLL